MSLAAATWGVVTRLATRYAATLVVITALGWLGSCSDSTAPTDSDALGPDTPAPEGIVLSNRMSALSVAMARHSVSVTLMSADGELAYVSLPPGTVAAGAVADVHRVGASSSVLTRIVDGGFDPVAIPVQTDDIVEVVVRNVADVVIYSERVAVTPKRSPVVVRTHPPRKKTDVAINSSIVVVFSEPVAAATVSPSSVRLLLGASPVAGKVQVLPGTGTTVAFTPNAPLRPNTSYRLVVTRAVTDLQGQALEANVVASFTTGTSSTGPVASITVSPDTVFMSTPTYQMTVTVRDAADNVLVDQPVTWATTDPSGLTVSATGRLTALAEGDNNVVASVGDVSSGYAHIQVLSPEPAALVTIVPNTGTVAAGDTLELSATVRDATGRVLRRQLTWSSSDPNVARLTSPGGGESAQHFTAVIGVVPGPVTITATSGDASATATITVNLPKRVASLVVSPASADLVLQGTVRLTATLKDADGRAIARPIAWTSDNTAVATVDANGAVTGAGLGSAAVVALSGGVSDTVAITVISVTFASTAAGLSHACGLDRGGAAYCWGEIVTRSRAETTVIFSSPSPAAIARGLAFVAVTSGANYSCGLTASGTAYCWGANGDGKLGGGPTARSSMEPLAVVGGHTFTSITAGDEHTCALTAAGDAFCWGYNGIWQLGTGGDTAINTSSIPLRVAGGHAFASLSAGSWHTCGVTLAGEGFCWGSNLRGELGIGTEAAYSPVPVRISGDLLFSSVNAGGPHSGEGVTCGVTRNGAAYCWGDNYWGQLGDGTGDGTERNSTVPVQVAGNLALSSVAIGGSFACGLTTTGAVYCWGTGTSGQLGDGTTATSSPVPVAVLGAIDFATVSAGGTHACGMSRGGVAYCWGGGLQGQLGHSASTNSSVPVKVAGQP